MTEAPQRKLVAILTADVVGYSRLIRADEEGTLAALKDLQTDQINPKIAEYNGRVVKLIGDGMLVEFASVVDAMRAAVATQKAVAKHNENVPKVQRIEFRIGINLGDVVIDGEDIHGDGVNIASRLEGLANPGGICVSAKVYEEVRDRLDIHFEDMGELTVKNIERPLHVWRWRPSGPAAVAGAKHPEAPLQVPEKPSIAVIPFHNMSGDPEQEYFADGIAEDIITALSRFHMFFVIARNTSFTFKGSNVDVKQAARELGVQYVLEGSVRKAAKKVRISAQLIDAASDRHVWVERYDRDLDDIFAIQDEITERVAMAVAPELQAAEMERARRGAIPELGVWELVARAAWNSALFTSDGSAEAQRLLSKAFEDDPENAGALSLLAQCYTFDGLYGWHRSPRESLAKAAELAQRAVFLNNQDEVAQTSLGIVLFASKKLEEAIQRLEAAIESNPNYSTAIGWLGITLVYTHQHDEAVELLNKAIRLSPRDPMLVFYIGHLGMREIMAERYEMALEWLEKAAYENPDLPSLVRGLVVVHGLLGNLHEAQKAFQKLIRLAPEATTVEANMRAAPFVFAADSERWAEGLRRAGVPE